MTSVMRTVAVLVCGGVLLVVAGAAQDEVQPAIERLLSPDVQEVVQARDEILAARAKLIAELVGIVGDKENLIDRESSVKAAMFILGEMRPTEAIEVLVSHIGYPYVRPRPPEPRPGPWFSMGQSRPWWQTDETHPAAAALVKIGEPCTLRVLDKLASTDNVGEEGPCLCVLVKLRGADGVAPMLQDALAKETDAKRRTRLDSALRMLATIGQPWRPPEAGQ